MKRRMSLTHLSDEALVASLASVFADERRLLARLIQHLVEVEDRRLHLKAACSSMFDFCVRHLGMSEGGAFRRINAARLVRRFPGLLGAIERGELHLSSLVLLRDHLTEANVEELVAATRGRSKREVEELLARRAPRPDVPSTLRRLPAQRRPAASAAPPAASAEGTQDASNAPPVGSLAAAPVGSPLASPVGSLAPVPVGSGIASPVGSLAPVTAATPLPVPGAPPARARIEPLSDARYKLQLTASSALRDKLERARDLMRHRNPAGDLAVVVERALDALLAQLEKERLGKTARPKSTAQPSATAQTSTQPTSTARSTRGGGVARAVRRAVFERDGEQCTFTDPGGARCPSRAFLELDHVDSRALGGSDDASNLRVRCRAHNALHAEQVFGRAHVAAHVHFRHQKRRGDAPAGAHAELALWPDSVRATVLAPPRIERASPQRSRTLTSDLLTLNGETRG
jgi:hypothetical protein